MFVKKLFLTILVVFGIVLTPVWGQATISKNYKALEIYAGLGSTHYLGDVGGSSTNLGGVVAMLDNFGIDIEQTKYGGLVGFRYIKSDRWAFSTAISPLLISGSDHKSRFESRGFSFFTYVVEGSLKAEWFIANRITGVAPYAFLGAGALVYNAKDRQHQIWTGALFGSDILTGFGIRLPSKSKYIHAFELGFRYCNQDDIDFMEGKNLVGDTFYFLTYLLNLDLDRTFVYNHKGRINK